jgi:hypothetical protein
MNMTKNNLYHITRKLRATGVLLLALALSTFPAAFNRAVSAQTPAKAGTTSAGEPKGGPKEGIKVHGHWIIDVRNPDGTVVAHREFENALTSIGAITLAKILGRQRTPNLWVIFLRSGPNGVTPWLLNGVQPGFILEPNDFSPADFHTFKTLTVTVPTGTDANGNPVPNANKLVLSGNATALNAGQIGEVGTSLISCPANVLPGNPCVGFSDLQSATFATLNTPQSVSAGQIIQVTVVISFS